MHYVANGNHIIGGGDIIYRQAISGRPFEEESQQTIFVNKHTSEENNRSSSRRIADEHTSEPKNQWFRER